MLVKRLKPIMENTLKYLNVGKSKDAHEYSKVPDVEGQDKQKAIDNVSAKSLEPSYYRYWHTNKSTIQKQGIKSYSS